MHADPAIIWHFPTDLVQQGISEKVALVINFLAAFVTGFALAYARSWRLALAMTSMLPCIVITGAVMNRFVSKYMQYVYSVLARPLIVNSSVYVQIVFGICC